VDRLFSDADIAAALNASFVAEAQRAEALAANPDKVPAQWLEENATNPAGLDPWLLAVGRFAASALLADLDEGEEPQRAPGLALDGTLDAYLYGENIADSGRNGGEPRCSSACRASGCRRPGRGPAGAMRALLLGSPAARRLASLLRLACLPAWHPRDPLRCRGYVLPRRCVPQGRPHPLCVQVRACVGGG
jgi:hypothetical protein